MKQVVEARRVGNYFLSEFRCNIVSPHVSVHIGEVEIYEKVMELFWQRFLGKSQLLHIFGDVNRLSEAVEEAKKFLPHLSIEAMLLNKEFTLNTSLVENPTSASVPRDYAIFKSGMVSSTSREETNEGEGYRRCRFVHNTFLEYYCALHWKQMQAKELKFSGKCPLVGRERVQDGYFLGTAIA